MSSENENDQPKAPSAETPEGEAQPKPVPKAKAAEGGDAPAAPPKKEAAPPPPPEPGKFGKLLLENSFKPEALGNDSGGMEMILVKPDEWQAVAKFLRDSQGSLFDFLVSVSGVDWSEYRQAVYHLYSTRTFEAVCIKVNAGSDEKIPTVVPVWETADWHERETYDLYGIIFEGHPNLERILLPVDWIGYPMRKDYVQNDPRLVWNER